MCLLVLSCFCLSLCVLMCVESACEALCDRLFMWCTPELLNSCPCKRPACQDRTGEPLLQCFVAKAVASKGAYGACFWTGVCWAEIYVWQVAAAAYPHPLTPPRPPPGKRLKPTTTATAHFHHATYSTFIAAVAIRRRRTRPSSAIRTTPTTRRPATTTTRRTAVAINANRKGWLRASSAPPRTPEDETGRRP